MMNNPILSHRPIVLAISAHDPTGGAGIQADIETIGNCGCHAVSVLTMLTTQDTHSVKAHHTLSPSEFQSQLEVLLDDMPIQAVKIGALADPAMVHIIADYIQRYDLSPVVLDPVLAPSYGLPFSDQATLDAITKTLLPFVTMVTPNFSEAKQLANIALEQPITATQLATKIQSLGVDNVLITQTDNSVNTIEHLFFSGSQNMNFMTPKQPANYHGTGCTLAAAIAANLAQEPTQIIAAIKQAQQYVETAIAQAEALGQGQFILNRFG